MQAVPWSGEGKGGGEEDEEEQRQPQEQLQEGQEEEELLGPPVSRSKRAVDAVALEVQVGGEASGDSTSAICRCLSRDHPCWTRQVVQDGQWCHWTSLPVSTVRACKLVVMVLSCMLITRSLAWSADLEIDESYSWDKFWLYESPSVAADLLFVLAVGKLVLRPGCDRPGFGAPLFGATDGP
uniref:Uncharacterized protein n=1 Tax=Rhizochromulina marina TaxID=1034831 RepID=A0A6U0WGM0_9STRA|mmetsp:Transcript_10911/g.31316  ORF Transcript_10911/g.31316 Transcript_10911/m.31316 type:complete len:182 (+) Transcript_10911:51-596(+)